MRREIDPDTYADWVTRFIWAFLAPPETGAPGPPGPGRTLVGHVAE